MAGKKEKSKSEAACELGLNPACPGSNHCFREDLPQSHQGGGQDLKKTHKYKPCFFLGSTSGDSNSIGVGLGPRNTVFEILSRFQFKMAG